MNRLLTDVGHAPHTTEAPRNAAPLPGRKDLNGLQRINRRAAKDALDFRERVETDFHAAGDFDDFRCLPGHYALLFQMDILMYVH
jgi:hypothetical protein